MGGDRFLEQLARNWDMIHSHANLFDIDIKKLKKYMNWNKIWKLVVETSKYKVKFKVDYI